MSEELKGTPQEPGIGLTESVARGGMVMVKRLQAINNTLEAENSRLRTALEGARLVFVVDLKWPETDPAVKVIDQALKEVGHD